MGLIDDVRKKRDSWISRFEEQRQDDYDENYLMSEGINLGLSEEQIKKNLEMVGKLEKKK